MENKRSTGRTVLLVFAIIFSIVFVPVLVALPPVGGCVTSLMEMTSLEGLKDIAEESGMAEELYEMVMEEALAGVNTTQLDRDVSEEIIRDCIRVEDVKQWLNLVLEGMYTGDRVTVDLSDVKNRLEENISKAFAGGFDELYNAWKNGADNGNFSDEYVEELFGDWESDILNQYAMYGARDLDELEMLYDRQYGSGAFAKIYDEKVEELRNKWDSELDDLIADVADDAMAEAETEIEDTLYEMTQDSEVRDIFDGMQEANALRNVAKIVIFAIMFGIVLLLLLLYVFEVAGFVVTAVPLLIGGALCKLIAAANGPLMKYLDAEVFPTMDESEEVITITRSMIVGLLQPFFKGVSDFGNVVLIAAVALIGCAILRHVLKKNKQEEEASYM